METRCGSLHRLIQKAVMMLIVCISLLFYVIGVHTRYYQRLLTIIGSLKEADPVIQQQVLGALFCNNNHVEDGLYVLMKNGYYQQGQRFLYVDPFIISIMIVFIAIIFSILFLFKRNSLKKANELEYELNYLKEELEHYLFDDSFNRNDQYNECNFLLDRLEQKVYDVNKLKESEIEHVITFHQNIIHQINTPLNTIKFLTEQLANQGILNQEYQNTIQYAIERAAGLAHTYLRSSKMDAGKVVFECEEIQLHDLIEDIFKMLDITAKYFHMTLCNQCQNLIIYADEGWITEAIANIVKNAIENAGEDKKVVVSSKEMFDKVVIYIEDNGDASNFIDEVMFERFESSKTGIGIGLHLCKQIIEKHLGEITVERSSLGGLCFFISLPKYGVKQKTSWREKNENGYRND